MAKKTKISSFLLFTVAGALMVAGWLMAPFPILIFIALSPLLALADQKEIKAPVWGKMEYILLAIGVSFLAFSISNDRSVVASLVSSIAIAIAFVAHAWVSQTLGVRTGKITILIFWLAIEYLFLKFNPETCIFLADTLRLQSAWTRWNIHTGFLGGTLWILLVNWSVYKSFLTGDGFRWFWLLSALILLLGPIIYSYQLDNASITHQEMVNAYSSVPIKEDVNYLANGEFIVRTAAWLSTLILLFTFAKSQTTKR